METFGMLVAHFVANIPKVSMWQLWQCVYQLHSFESPCENTINWQRKTKKTSASSFVGHPVSHNFFILGGSTGLCLVTEL